MNIPKWSILPLSALVVMAIALNPKTPEKTYTEQEKSRAVAIQDVKRAHPELTHKQATTVAIRNEVAGELAMIEACKHKPNVKACEPWRIKPGK
jgi:hypothetical protein